MKKLFLYIFIGLTWCSIGIAEKIYLIDIKIGSKVTDFFTVNEIFKYYENKAEKNIKGEEIYGKDLKYSAIAIADEKKIGDGHSFIQIYYENKTDKIVATSGAIVRLKLDQCIELRDKEVSKYVKKKLFLNFTKDKDTHTYPDGMKDDFIRFHGDKSIVGFRCYIYEDGRIDYRYSDSENKFSEWLFNQFNEE